MLPRAADFDVLTVAGLEFVARSAAGYRCALFLVTLQQLEVREGLYLGLGNCAERHVEHLLHDIVLDG